MAEHHKHPHRTVKHPKHVWVPHDPAMVSPEVQTALKTAMNLEKVEPAGFDDLLWIMAQESRGVVDVRNPRSTARGLFQLLKAQYSLNPKGEESFGNAVEECQGGIHYILGRYHTVAAARAHWETHHWY